MFKDADKNEIDDGEGKGADDETDAGIEDGVFGFFGFAGVARRGHILKTTDDDKDDCNNTSDTNYNVEDALDGVKEIAGTTTAGGFFNFGGSAGRTNIVSKDWS